MRKSSASRKVQIWFFRGSEAIAGPTSVCLEGALARSVPGLKIFARFVQTGCYLRLVKAKRLVGCQSAAEI